MPVRVFTYLQSHWKSWLIQLVVFFFIYLAIHYYQTRSTPSGIMPSVVGQELSGQWREFPRDLEGPTLVHFWATWCTVCRLEQGSINSIADNHRVIAIASQSGTRQQVQQTVTERGITAPVIVDESGNLASKFGVRAFPSSFIVDKDGTIRYTEVGYTTEWGLRFRLWLAEVFS